MRRRNPQSNIESQERARASYIPTRATLPRDYPKRPAFSFKPEYRPVLRMLPRDYPGVIQQRNPARFVNTGDLPAIARKANAPEKHGYTKAKPFVLSTFDARPINAIDFVDTFSSAEQVAGDTLTFTYNVPQGRVAVFRKIDLRVYMSAAARDAVTGAPTEALTLSFNVNGGGVEQANNIRIDDAICSPTWLVGISIPLYFLAPAESIVQLIISNTAGGTQIAFAAPVVTGNLLFAEGVNPTSEPGTQWPLPIKGS